MVHQNPGITLFNRPTCPVQLPALPKKMLNCDDRIERDVYGTICSTGPMRTAARSTGAEVPSLSRCPIQTHRGLPGGDDAGSIDLPVPSLSQMDSNSAGSQYSRWY